MFDIMFQKPNGREKEANSVWIELFKASFLDLEDEQTDLRELADDVAADVGLTSEQSLSRGIGLSLLYDESACFWFTITFWGDVADISLPNFPENGIDHALSKARPYLDLFLASGFLLLDPESGKVVTGHIQEALIEAYRRRQEQVLKVAKLVNGEPGGRIPSRTDNPEGN
jgi:hypothetical protein